MAYLAHSVHPQFVGLCVGSVGWILTMVTIGLVQWRVWMVADVSVISSGLAWVGIWKVCFYSHVVSTMEHSPLYCQKMGVTDSFVPTEIVVAQVLMLVALVLGLLANASTLYGLRNVFFSLDERKPIRLAFTLGGLLHLSASVCSLVPLCLNLRAVVTNQNISFPENFHMPAAPMQQHVGEAVGVGITAAVLMVASGLMFLCYRFPVKTNARVQPVCGEEGGYEGPGAGWPLSHRQPLAVGRNSTVSCYARDNPAFLSQEHIT